MSSNTSSAFPLLSVLVRKLSFLARKVSFSRNYFFSLSDISQAYISAFLISLLSFLFTTTFVILFPRSNFKTPPIQYLSLSFAATTLIVHACLHLLPSAFQNQELLEGFSHEKPSSSGTKIIISPREAGFEVALGGLCVFALHTVLSITVLCTAKTDEARPTLDSDDSSASDEEDFGHVQSTLAQSSCGQTSLALTCLAVKVLGNFVDGLGLGLAFLSGGTGLGLAAAVGITMRKIPQEAGDFLVLRVAGIKDILLWNGVIGLACVAGVLLVDWQSEDAHAQSGLGFIERGHKRMQAATGGCLLSLGFSVFEGF